MRVIIADDEPIIRMDLKEILEKEGYTVAVQKGTAGFGYHGREDASFRRADRL